MLVNIFFVSLGKIFKKGFHWLEGWPMGCVVNNSNIIRILFEQNTKNIIDNGERAVGENAKSC